MLEIFVKGGPVMWPLLLCSVVALAVALERAWFIYRARMNTRAGRAILSARRRKGRSELSA